jgi:hypothetical protein
LFAPIVCKTFLFLLLFTIWGRICVLLFGFKKFGADHLGQQLGQHLGQHLGQQFRAAIWGSDLGQHGGAAIWGSNWGQQFGATIWG